METPSQKVTVVVATYLVGLILAGVNSRWDVTTIPSPVIEWVIAGVALALGYLVPESRPSSSARDTIDSGG